MRFLRVVALVALLVAGTTLTAQAQSGWARYDHDTWVKWRVSGELSDTPTQDQVQHYLARVAHAKHHAVLAHRRWLSTRIVHEVHETSALVVHAHSPAHHEDHYGNGSVPALIRAIFGSASPTALCVGYRESRFNPRAYNPSGAAGVFQLMPIWYNQHWHFDPFNAYLNIHYAHLMYLDYGWGPWGGGC